MKLWIFIGRMQPIHLWHQKIINKSLEENNMTFIIFWSSWIRNKENIFSDKQREKFLQILYQKEIQENKISYNFLEDTKSDKSWVRNIFQRVIPSLKLCWKADIITFYWWDFKNDYAIRIIKQYQNMYNNKNIQFKEFSREELDISSTQVRDALEKWKNNLLQKMLDKKVFLAITGNNNY